MAKELVITEGISGLWHYHVTKHIINVPLEGDSERNLANWKVATE